MNGNTPNADEIVKALHVLGRVGGKYCTTKCKECPAKQFSTEHPSGCCEYGTMKAAADLIKSLTTQLAESQLREKAAVEDLERMMSDDLDECEICSNEACYQKGGTGIYCEPKWRGVAEGEKA